MKTSRKLILLAVTFFCVAAIAMPAFAASFLPMSDDTPKCETTLTINSRGMASHPLMGQIMGQKTNQTKKLQNTPKS